MTQPYGPEPGRGQPEYERYGGQPPAQYGQPYQPQDRRAQVANAYGAPIGSGAKFGVVGATFAGVGLILLIISFTALAWFSGAGFGNSHFGDVHRRVESYAATGIASAYFSWLGWVLLIGAVVIAIAATLPSPAAGPLRALGAVVSAAAITATLFAIQLADGPSYTDWLKHTSIGFYLAVAGFLLTGIGALCGPQRR